MNFKNILRDSDLKVTLQRVHILEITHSLGHISIDDLHVEVKKVSPNISLATLYKNLHVMVKANILKELKIPNLKSKYEIKKEPHAHLLCSTCNEFIDIKVDIENVLKSVATTSSYKINSSELIIDGVCLSCQELKGING
ncbi:MAG: Fur family transcriptional regulator [Campylobacterota bacterium]|nr:Fur family transcriptional regulator [Campylobacterota bacterium]